MSVRAAGGVAPLSLAMLTVFLGTGLLAYRYGGPPERVAAAFMVVWILADALYHQLYGPSSFREVDPVHLTLDGGELALLSWLALRADRLWPMWAAAALVICMIGHLVVTLEPGGVRRAYWAMTQLPPFVMVVALLWGTAAHVRRERQFGASRSWRRP